MARVVVEVGGNMAAMLDADLAAIGDGLRRAVQRTAEALQEDLRGQVRAAGLGTGLEKAWRMEVYPRSARKKTLRPAALVYSKATRLHEAFNADRVITPQGRFLVIALPEAVKLGFGAKAVDTGELGRFRAGSKRKYSQLGAAIAKLGEENLRLVPRRNGGLLVVWEAKARVGKTGLRFSRRRGSAKSLGAVTVPLFLLLPQVRVRRRLDLDAAGERAERHLSLEINASWI